MKKLKFTKDGLRSYLEFDGGQGRVNSIEAFTHDELFEPMEIAKGTYLVCKKCLKIIDVNGDSYHNEQHDSYTGEVSGNFFYSWTCPVCVEKEKKREAETCVHRSLA